MNRNRTLGAAAVAALVLLGACSSGSASLADADGGPSTSATPVAEPEPIVAGVPTLELLAPGATVSDPAPEFSWVAVADAASYRLVVVGPLEPVWAWEGTETSVRLGGLDEDTGDGFPVPELAEGSSWSVVALDDHGAPLAASGRSPLERTSA